MAQTSPKDGLIQLVKPSGVIKLKIKKKRATTSPSVRISNALKPINGPVQDGGRGKALKRKNPFRCSPRKKPNLTSEGKTPDCRLFSALDGLDENLENVLTNTAEVTTKKAQNETFENDSEPTDDIEPAKDKIEGSKTFPLDWSIKSKIRFTSSKSFTWCGTLKTLDEAKGLSDFVRCQAKASESCGVVSESARDSNYPSSFCSFTKVWIHPSLPWLELFPRKSIDGKAGSKKDLQVSNEMASSLQRYWVSSFRSVFNQTRVGFCPYFYLVANQCTMLFQAAQISRTDCVQVFITPTTRGFRDALRNEGINFTMPHLGEKGKRESGIESQNDVSDEDDEVEPGDNSDDEYGDKREWLESMGLDKGQFPLLNPKAFTPHQINNLRTVDQQPTSTVLVRGADTHALFNFILNCKSLVANTGPLAQVPPTLLAPVAFDGATLKGLRTNQGILKHQQAKGMTQLYTMEISGPILPGCVYELSQLLKASQNGDFKATLSAHQPTVAFNVPSRKTQSDGKSLPFGPHLEHSISQGQLKYYQEGEQLKGNCLKELDCKDGLFTWMT